MDTWIENPLEPFFKLEKAHLNSIETLKFNPVNASEMASGSHDHTIKLWDVTKVKELKQLQGHSEGVWSLAYSMNGKQLFSASPDRSILVWDMKSAKTVQALKEHKNRIYWIEMSDNDQYLISGGQDGHVIVWDIRKWKMVKDLQASMDIIYNLNFVKSSKYFFSGDSLGVLKAYDTLKLEEICKTQAKSKKEKILSIQSIKNQNDTYKLIVGQKNQCVCEYEFDPIAQTITKKNSSQVHFDAVYALTLDKTGSRFATGCRDGCARLWEMERKNDHYVPVYNLIGHKQRVTAVEFHSTNKMLGTCSWDENIHLYKI